MKRLFSLTGSVTFSIIGGFAEEFVSEVIANGIDIGNIHNDNNIIYADVRRIDYLKISGIAKKHRVRIRVQKRHGIYFKVSKARKRTGILMGVLIASLVLLATQQFIWKIEIHGADKLSENLILETISENGIKLGALLSGIDSNEAEIRLKSTLKNISWVNIEINGSRADVYVRETDSIKKSEISLKTPCNVVAGRTGVIVETEVYSGTLIYPKGSGVSKGNVIVSGIVNDGADNIIMAHANAKIIAEFTETVEVRQDYTTVEKEKNGISETEKELMLFGFVFPITDTVSVTENKVCTEQIENCTLFGFNLPWKIKINTYTSYDDISVTRTAEDAMRLAEQKIEIYCNNFFSEYEVLDIIKTIKNDETGITIIADVKLKGNIAVQQEIKEKY